MNQIEVAVAPLKIEAQDSAEHYARAAVAKMTEQLAAAGNDINAVAPRPRTNVGKFEYRQASSRRAMFSMITKRRQSGSTHYAPSAPEIVDVDAELVAKFVADARRDAAETFDHYVGKLTKKIGPTRSAKLDDGRALWSFSTLRVVTADGREEAWRTQQIVNVSVLGKVFNQWPTRQIAGEKRAVEKKVAIVHLDRRAFKDSRGGKACIAGYSQVRFSGSISMDAATVTCPSCRSVAFAKSLLTAAEVAS